jgi:hypothetical protein
MIYFSNISYLAGGLIICWLVLFVGYLASRNTLRPKSQRELNDEITYAGYSQMVEHQK